MASVISVAAKVTADASGFINGMNKAETAAKQLETAASSATSRTAANFDAGTSKIGGSAIRLGKILATAAKGFLLFQGVNFMRSAVAGASAFEAEFEGVNQAFGEGAKLVQEFAKNAAATAGVAEVPALRAAKSFGVFASSAGLAGEEAGKFATNLVQAAGDLGSFYDLPTEQALSAISAGLRGETEPLRRFNILIGEAEMKSKAMQMGLGANVAALTQQEKVLVRNQLILDGLGVAQGDFVKYQTTYGNSIKTVGALFQNLQKDVGAALLPVLAKLAGALVPIIEKLGPLLSKVFEALVPVIQAVVDNLDKFMPTLDPLVNILAVFAELFADIIEVVLPPFIEILNKILPFVEQLAGVFAKMVRKVLPPFVKLLDKVLIPVLDFLITLLTEYGIPILEALADVMGDTVVNAVNLLVDGFEWLKSILQPIWDNVIKPLVEGLMSLAGIKPINIKVNTEFTSSGDKYDLNRLAAGGNNGGTQGTGGKKPDATVNTLTAGGTGGGKSRADIIKDLVKQFKGLKDAITPLKTVEREIGRFEAQVRSSFKSVRDIIKSARLEGLFTKKQAAKIVKYVKAVRAELMAIAKERDALDKKIADLESIKQASEGFKESTAEMLKGTLPLKFIEEEIGRFEQQVTSSFEAVEQTIQDGLNMKLLSKGVAEKLRKDANTAKAQLMTIAKQRDALTKNYNEMVDKLNASREFRKSTKEALQATIDITAMGRSARSMIIGLTKQVAATQAFGEKMSKLRSMGLNKAAYDQLLKAGYQVGGATADGLIKGGQTSIDQINALYSQMEDVSETIATDAENYMFDGGETAIQGFIDGILAEDKQLYDQATTIAKNFNTAFQTEINKARTKLDSQIASAKAESERLRQEADAIAKRFNEQFEATLKTGKAKLDKQIERLLEQRPAFKQAGRDMADAFNNAFTNRLESISSLTTVFNPSGINNVRSIPNQTSKSVVNNSSVNVTVNAGLGTNGAAVGKEIVNYINQYQRSSGVPIAAFVK